MWPEPSMDDHGAPWNEEEVEDENGEIIEVRCGCVRCRRRRLEESE